jgi:GT2 family glycosyltransferase
VARVSAVVVAFGSEPWLERSVAALLASEGVDVDVVVVDNGCTDGGVASVAALPDVTVVRPGSNLGFAGGCNAGAARATGEVVAFVNPDAVVEPGCLAALAAATTPESVGIATASVRLDSDPKRLNSGGNVIHLIGFSWAGCFGEPASAWSTPRDVTSASGAAMAMRLEVWRELGGMVEEMFAYYEDAELSLRCWQRGRRVVYVPDAVVVHRYEFGRNPTKNHLVERNRLWMVLTVYERRTLLLLLPGLAAAELAVVGMAVRGGWFRAKTRGWWWLLRHRAALIARRRTVQTARLRTDRELAGLWEVHLDPGNYPLPGPARHLDKALAAYLEAVRRRL